jgi:RHS repeat-associated protein
VLAGFLLAPVDARAQEEAVYYHTDAIGSVRMVTDASGAVVARYDYLPFGEPWPATPPNPNPDVRQFTGKGRDTETGLDYFGARYYASQTGRFTTVDPVLDIDQALVDPQRWNRYTYVRNNPFRYVDPDGRASGRWDWDDFISVGEVADGRVKEIQQHVTSSARSFRRRSRACIATNKDARSSGVTSRNFAADRPTSSCIQRCYPERCLRHRQLSGEWAVPGGTGGHRGKAGGRQPQRVGRHVRTGLAASLRIFVCEAFDLYSGGDRRFVPAGPRDRSLPVEQGPHLRRRQQNRAVSQALDLARPEVRGAARLHHDRRRRPIHEELEERRPWEPMAFDDLAWLVGHDDLEHRLREINGAARGVQHEWTPPAAVMRLSTEESISSPQGFRLPEKHAASNGDNFE